MKRLILLLLCATLCHATSVTIAESTYADASGRLATGTITISWPSFSNGVSNIAAGSTTVTVTAGVLSVSLVANDTADPPMFYTASFRLQAASYSQQWKVPTVAGPLAIQSVTWSSNSPVTVGLDQLRRSGYTAGDIAYYDGILWKRLARGTNGQSLTIDTSLSGYLKWATAAGSGDFSSNTASSVDSEVVLFSGTGGKTGKRATISGLGKFSSGVLSAAVAGTDYESPITAGTTLQYLRGDKSLATLNTAIVPELTNLYFTNARAQSAMSGLYEVPLTFTAPIVRTVNAIAMAAATASVSGYLATADWNTFNGKQAALGFTPPANTLTINTTSPITGGGDLSANRTIACATCTKSAAAMTADAVLAGAGGQSVVATNCTKATGQPLTCPDGFNSGGGTGPWFMDIAGDTSGSIRLKAASASVSQWIATFPAATGIVMYTDTAVTAAQLPAFTGDVTKSSGSAATTVGKLNGVSLAGLATGPLCNTTSTGVPYACAASDLPAHASRHQNGGNDEIATATPAANVIPKAGSSGTLAAGFTPAMWTSGLTIPGATLKVATVNSGAATDVDVYTAPGGKRASVGVFNCYNTAGTSTTIIPKIKISGTYYRIAASVTILTLAANTTAVGPILEPGDSASLNFSQTGTNCTAFVLEYPSTVALYSPRLTSFSAGDNTVYTVPVSKGSYSISPSNFIPTGSGSYMSDTTHTIKWFVVSSGGSTGTANQMTPSAPVSLNTLSSQTPYRAGNAGDFVVINVDSNTGVELAWINVAELP